MISDTILFLFAILFFFQQRNYNQLWSYFFLFMGLSALFGALYHGFEEQMEQLRYISWTFLYFALVFSLIAEYRLKANVWVLRFFVFKGLPMLFLSIYYQVFFYMMIDTLVSLVFLIVVAHWLRIIEVHPLVITGILLSFSSVFFQLSKINIDDNYLNYNDIGHYISIISMMLMSKGIKEKWIEKLETS
jgi:hypothetical protein